MTNDVQAHSSDLINHMVIYTIACWAIYVVILTVYRVTIHPLSRFPGPMLAGTSYWYEFWFEVICGIQYTQKIQELHELYGPIVRINPDELHFNDPGFLDVVYAAGGRKRDKPNHYMSGFAGASNSTFGTIGHNHHRIRRKALNKFFSKPSVQQVEEFIHVNSQKFCDKVLAHRGRGSFDATGAFSCLATDTVTEFCFGINPGFLDQPDWEPNCKNFFDTIEKEAHITRHIPWSRYLIKILPLKRIVTSLTSKLDDCLIPTEITPPAAMKRVFLSAQQDAGINRSILKELLDSDLPAQEKSFNRLMYEARGATFAGCSATAIAISNVAYNLVINPRIYQRLRAELSAKVPDPKELPSWSNLEELPYLTAVIQEGLRLMYDPSMERLPYDSAQERLPRISPEEDLVYEGEKFKYTIPRGYAIGTSAYIIHTDETLFPDASQFIPERWLHQDGQKNNDLKRYLQSFSRGSRYCLGMQ